MEQRSNLATDTRQVRIAPIFPGPSQAIEFPWSDSIARRQLVHGFNSRNASSRSFNLIRSKLVSIHRERGWRMLGVASATPNVGKSFVSANLAAALSRDPRFQTYLLDLDLRRGTLKDIFGIQADESILEYLDGADSNERLPGFIPQGQELIIIPSIAGEVHSAELLAGERATALFRAMRNSDERNFFICDLPPVFANDDAAIIMEALDGYVIVAQDGKTTQREISATVDMLGQERLIGVVLNKYRGGLVSEGYGIEERYASEYYSSRDSEE
jgi:Mrp family chromosome partitioning ATPase